MKISAFALFVLLSSVARAPLIAAQSAVSQIIIDPSNPAAELTVNEGSSIRVRPRALDSAGNVVEDAPLSYASLSPEAAAVDAAGNIEGKKAGFSTLAVSSGTVVATATVTVVRIASGVSGFDITGVTQDLARRLYLANTKDHTILLAEDLQQTPDVYAGVNQTPGLINAERQKSLFRNPAFLAFNQAEGSLYVSDSANHVIRQARSGFDGLVMTLAGTGQPGSRDGALAESTFNNPQGIALDSRGFLWVADSGNHVIRRINLARRTVETIAGQPGSTGLADGRGAQARFHTPTGIAIEPESLAEQLQRERRGELPPPVSVIVADAENGRLRRVSEDGRVETIAASADGKKGGTPEYSAAPLTFGAPVGVAVDPFGNIFVSDGQSGEVKAVLKKGAVVAAAQANTFSAPKGIVISSSGQVIVADSGRTARQIIYGQPRIASVTPNRFSDFGGARVTVKGQNFAPDTLVVASGIIISDVEIVDTETLRFTAPALPSGQTTLTLQNRGGLAQTSLLVSPAPFSQIASGQITTIAGGSTFSGDGGQALSAALNFPWALAFDSSGNLYVADYNSDRIRRIDARIGIITTVAGTGRRTFDGDNRPAIAASLAAPDGLVFDSEGNLYIADGGNNRIRRVDARTGIITTVAGAGEAGFGGDGGPATAALLNFPDGLALDSAENLLIADYDNHRIRKIDRVTGMITTVAGAGDADFSGDNGPARAAALNHPEGVAVDSKGNIYIADTDNHRIRKVDAPTGTITTVAGTGEPGFSGDDGLARAAALDHPEALALDSAGNIYVADSYSNRIRRVDARTGVITTVAGTGQSDFGGDGGPAQLASLSYPVGLAIDSAQDLYIADTYNHRIRKVNAQSGAIETVAGVGRFIFAGDNGPATTAALNFPYGLLFDSKGNLYIADSENFRVRKIDAGTGLITTVAGTGQSSAAGDHGPATAASVGYPVGLAFDSAENLYITDYDYHRIRRVDARTGIITTVAGSGQPGFAGDNGPAVGAALYGPEGVAVDLGGNIYIADTSNHRIRRVDARTGIITTIAGTGKQRFGGDNGPAIAADLNWPEGLTLDSRGNIYIADTWNDRIRRVDARTGIITTVAGTGKRGFSGDGGPAVAADLNRPVGVTFGSAGDIYIADAYNDRMRKVDGRTGVVTTVAGSGRSGFGGDGGPAIAAALSYPWASAFDLFGNLFIADSGNGRIRGIRAPIGGANLPSLPRRRP